VLVHTNAPLPQDGFKLNNKPTRNASGNKYQSVMENMSVGEDECCVVPPGSVSR